MRSAVFVLLAIAGLAFGQVAQQLPDGQPNIPAYTTPTTTTESVSLAPTTAPEAYSTTTTETPTTLPVETTTTTTPVAPVNTTTSAAPKYPVSGNATTPITTGGPVNTKTKPTLQTYGTKPTASSTEVAPVETNAAVVAGAQVGLIGALVFGGMAFLA